MSGKPAEPARDDAKPPQKQAPSSSDWMNDLAAVGTITKKEAELYGITRQWMNGSMRPVPTGK